MASARVGTPKLGQDIRHVVAHRFEAEHERVGDLGIGHSTRTFIRTIRNHEENGRPLTA